MAEAPAPAVYFDTHAHLADPSFGGELDPLLDRAGEAGVDTVVAVGYDLFTSETSVALAGRPGIWAAVGIHPNSASEATSEALARIGALARDPKVVAVGETGLDYYRDRVAPETQRRVFEAHLLLADRVDKPVVVHDREAHGDVLRMLVEWAAGRRVRGKRSVPGVLHCFSGDIDLAEAAIAAGFLISFAGSLTYRSGSGLSEVASRVDLGSIVLETDCPYLTPERTLKPSPRRRDRNEPANVVITAERLAALRGLPVVEVARRTSANARRLFGLEASAVAGQPADRTS